MRAEARDAFGRNEHLEFRRKAPLYLSLSISFVIG
jgi:hypothetical protein